jgi:hypothetical protein
MSWVQHAPAGDAADHGHLHEPPEGVDLMGGMVLGITVRPDDDYAPALDVPRRTLRLHIGRRDAVFGEHPGYGFVLQEGPDPPPMDVQAGRTYRLRFINISPDENKTIRLLDGDTPVLWTEAAKDGADLPPSRVRTVPADVLFFDVGNTLDVLWTPEAAGERMLRIITTYDPGVAPFRRDVPPPDTTDIPIRVRAAPAGQAGEPSDPVRPAMDDVVYTLAEWRVRPGMETEFVTAWQDLGSVFARLPDPPGTGTLLRSVADPTLFYSFGPWSRLEAVEAMRADPDAQAAIRRLAELCTDATPGTFRLVARAEAPSPEPR